MNDDRRRLIAWRTNTRNVSKALFHVQKDVGCIVLLNKGSILKKLDTSLRCDTDIIIIDRRMEIHSFQSYVCPQPWVSVFFSIFYP